MTNGLNFDEIIRERQAALAQTVIGAFCNTTGSTDPAAAVAHDFLRQLLLSSGYDEEGLQLWEYLSRSDDHAS